MGSGMRGRLDEDADEGTYRWLGEGFQISTHRYERQVFILGRLEVCRPLKKISTDKLQ